MLFKPCTYLLADIARYPGAPNLFASMDRIWDDITLKKMYVTAVLAPRDIMKGSPSLTIYPTRQLLPKHVPPLESYCGATECFCDTVIQYIHVLECSLYSGLLSGVSLDGCELFYANPLASYGNHHRQPWFGCACCPTNVVRFVPQVDGYFYATTEDSLWGNLYAANWATVSVADQTVNICQESDFP